MIVLSEGELKDNVFSNHLDFIYNLNSYIDIKETADKEELIDVSP